MQLTHDDVSVGLIAMAYQLRGQKPEDINDSMVTAWLSTLQRNQFSGKEFAMACAFAVDRGTFFPAVGEFMAPVLRLRPGISVIHDPVVTATNESGCDTIESRFRAKRLGLTYREMHDETTVLLVTAEQRAEANNRLGRLSVAELSRSKRIKATDVIAQDKRLQALPDPTPEEIESRKRVLRDPARERTA